MTNLKWILAAALAMSLSAGCVPATEKQGDPWCTENCESNPTDPETEKETEEETEEEPEVETKPEVEPERSLVEGLFISGHLGNYWDCPEDGYTGDSGSSDEPEPGAGFAPGDGDCAEESCGLLNCEDAQVSIRLANGGGELVTAIQVERLELLDEEGTVHASLPIIHVGDTDRDEPFDGSLDGGEEANLRIDFQGPANLHELMGRTSDGAYQESAYIRIVIEADDHEDIVIESPELYTVPSVAT